MTIQAITDCLENWAPLAYQESYDNAGLIVGDPVQGVTGVLVCLDSTEAVIQEAVDRKCNLIVAHHPILFSGIKTLTGKTYVERTILAAIRHGVAIYAIHTNLDNVHDGVNRKIAERLGLLDLKVLAPKQGLLKKLFTFCPLDHAETVRQALFAAGAGSIGDYDGCSFNAEGVGTFRGSDGTQPFVGEAGKAHRETEVKIEVIFPGARQGRILSALHQAHPYEEVAFDVVRLDNQWERVGAGMIGTLADAMDERPFLEHVKRTMETGGIRYTALRGRPVRTVAVCGGSGSFLLEKARQQGADVFITSDFKYHQFFDADGQVVIADIGHYESEQFTKELIRDFLTRNFPTFAVHLTDVNTNPVNYL